MKIITYTCAICGEKFSDKDANTAARERQLHEGRVHSYVAPTLDEMIAERASILALAGFPVGTRVRSLVDSGNPAMPVRAGSIGTVFVNLATSTDLISVRFDNDTIAHALRATNLEVA